MQLLVNIVVLAAIYALIACGYVIVYRASRVLNLAHGELMMLGAYLLIVTAAGLSHSPFLAIAAAAGLSLLIGVLVYMVLMRRMTGESALAAVLSTIALGILIRGLVLLIWSAQRYNPATLLGVANPVVILPGGGRISAFSLALVVWTAVVYASVFAILRFGRWGIRFRAAGQNPLLASQRGINLHLVYAMAWGLATLTAGSAGILIAIDTGLDGNLATIGLKAFPAALVGGLDSLVGALVGSLIIAVCEVLLTTYVDPLLSDVVPFMVLIAMLAVRPWGLFGTREELDRV